ncbi:MAG: serine hydrolase [Caldithrix sp.]|nr:serine hydrolase [Caldithrix sp.]
MRKGVLISIIIVLISLQMAPAANIKEHADVQRTAHLLHLWLEAQRDYEQIPGLAMAVVYDQQVIFQRGYGYSNLQTKQPTTPETIHSICSISKLFTSIAVMQLRDAGKLRLDDAVADHLPWYNIEQIYPDSPPVTIEGLLTHSSGLPRESDYPYWSFPEFQFPSREAMIEKLSQQKTLYPAFKYFQYSNLGLTLAGEIVRELSGQPYAEYVNERIIEPLGLKDTRPYLPEDRYGGQLAKGYSAMTREGKRVPLPIFQAEAITPAAGFSSTVEDLARFASWQMRLLDTNTVEVLHPNTLKEMHRVHWLDKDWEYSWGLGFSISRMDNKTFIGHGGSCPGYRSQILIQPDDQMGMVFMANASGINTRMYIRTAHNMMQAAVQQAVQSTDRGTVTDSSLLVYTGAYSDKPWGGETAVFPWKEGLAMVSLPTENPMDGIVQLKHIADNVFERIRDDGSAGETIIFEKDDAGNVTHMRRHSNRWPKIR